VQQVPQQNEPHCGDSIVLHFAEVDLSSCGSSFNRLIGGFVWGLQGLVHIVAALQHAGLVTKKIPTLTKQLQHNKEAKVLKQANDHSNNERNKRRTIYFCI